MDVPAAIADERRRLAGLIDTLSPRQLEVPSLCAGWTVKQVIGHLVAAFATPTGAVPFALLRSGFSPHRMNSQLATKQARRPPADLADDLRAHAEPGSKPPPVVGWAGPLTDLQIHGQDIRRPLGLPHGLDNDRMIYSLDFLTGGRAVGFTPRRRVDGLRFETSDLRWAYGSGPLVEGPAEALLLALTGRRVALPDLDGPGVRLLAARLN